AKDGLRTEKIDTEKSDAEKSDAEKSDAEKSLKPGTPTTSPSVPAGEDRRRAAAPSTKPAITPVPGLPFTIPAAG
ncbi:hypothetical protein ACWDNR_22415, partial [Gordonia aichiensis]